MGENYKAEVYGISLWKHRRDVVSLCTDLCTHIRKKGIIIAIFIVTFTILTDECACVCCV